MSRPAFDLRTSDLRVVGNSRFGTPKEPVCSLRLSIESIRDEFAVCSMRDEFAVCFSFADGQDSSKVRVLGLRFSIVLPPVDLRLDIVDRASLADVAS